MKNKSTVIDLSHTLKHGMPVFPGDPLPEFHRNSSIEKDNYRDTIISITTHTGTHIDSPGHILPAGRNVNEYKAEQFYGKGCLVDCLEIKAGSFIKKDLLQKFESQIKTSSFILLLTGWDRFWGKHDYFKNFPTLDFDAAQYLSQFNLKGVGLDTPSIDPVESTNHEIHHILLTHDITIIENLTNLASLISKNFYFCCFPLKIEGSDGSPVRAAAIL